MLFDDPFAAIFMMRAPCAKCGASRGRIEKKNDQNCVFCTSCGAWAYNAPKVETGEAVRSMSDRPEIKPSKRHSILARDHFRCRKCGRPNHETIAHIAHVIGVKEGRAAGLSDEQLFHEKNLVSLCELCNAGQGAVSYEPWEMAMLFAALRIATRSDR